MPLRLVLPLQSHFLLFWTPVPLFPAVMEKNHVEICYITEYTIKLSFSEQTNTANTFLVWQHIPRREICDLYPSIKPMFGWKKGLCSTLYCFFSHVPSSYCESQYDLSERVRGKWADHCQLLYPEGGWGSTCMSENLSLDMKVAVNVAHYCFERLHLKKKNLPGMFLFVFFCIMLVIPTNLGKNKAALANHIT